MDLADARLSEEKVKNADRLREEAREELEQGNTLAAAELLAEAGDKFAAAADGASLEVRAEKRLKSARMCREIAEALESNHSASKSASQNNLENDSNASAKGELANGDSIVADMITQDPEVDLGDYVGRADLKEKIERKVFSHAEEPELNEEFGVKPANGFILYGPPGSGKTFFTKCMAGETDMPFVEIDLPELTSKYVNESAQLIRDTFQEVREHGPMMVCINELDSLAMSRDSEMTNSEQKAINQLLTEVEDLKDSRSIIVGTTNKIEEIDEAMRRSGRFTDEFEVGIPGEDFRRKALRQFMQNRPLARGWDLEAAVEVTEGCTPADLEEICNEAARIARDHYKQTGEKGITNEMFEHAVEDILG